jgi:hypothetical protein
LLASKIESFVEYLGDPSFVLFQGQPIQLSGIDCNALHKRTLTALRGVGVIKEWHYAVENEVLILRVKLEPKLVLATAEKIKRNQKEPKDEVPCIKS